MAQHGEKGNHGGGVTFYVIVALILGAITYVEFAIIEYEIAWLNTGTTLFLLIALSLVKFALVVAIYMHLRGDDPLYTGFFASGMVIAMGTFIALSFLFTVRSVTSTVQAQEAGAEEVIEGNEIADEQGIGELELLLAEERPLVESYRVPEPKVQTVQLRLPEAAQPTYSLRPVSTLAAAEPQETQDSSPETENAETGGEAVGDETETGGAETEDAEAATEETDGEAPTEADETETGGEEAQTASAEIEDAEASDETEAASVEFDEALGESVYSANCVACHQPNGQGIANAFPPLAGHIPDLYNADGGREYIINTVLYGLQGELQVQGNTYNGIMNPWQQLSNEEIAATLNHELVSWDNEALLEDFSPIQANEVEALRGQDLSAAQVLELRPALP